MLRIHGILATLLAFVLGACSPSSEPVADEAPLLSQASGLATAVWERPASLAALRADHTTTMLPSGQVLVAGGQRFNSTLPTAELFDTATNSWASTGSLAQARRNHTATMLPPGQVLVVGGQGPDGTLTSAELYEPTLGAWAPVGALLEARGNHTATLLPSGQVLVVGGQGANGPLASAELYDPASGTWTATGSLSEARSGATVTLLASGRVLAVGGQGSNGPLSSAELYDPATGTWAATGSLSAARSGASAIRLPSGQVLVVGGQDANGPLASAELFAPATGTWAATGSLSAARSEATASLLPSGQVLVAGGQDANGPLASAELFALATGTWTGTLALSQARTLHTATLLPSGKVFVVGGLGSSGPLATVEAYNPAGGAWIRTGPATQRREYHAAALLPSGKVLVSGGYRNNSYDPYSGYLNSAELYDPVTDTWSLTASMAERRQSHTATLLPSGKVLVVGGTQQYNSALTSAELYDPATGTWTPTGSLTHGRFNHTATLLHSGLVLVTGGYSYQALNSAELYDPTTGTWTVTGSLAQARRSHTTTLLPSGKVLVAGGYGNNNALSSAELYDPDTGAWTANGSLLEARYKHTATLLASGKVLFAGGSGSRSYSNTSDLYDPATGTWTRGASMNRGHFIHVAALLPSGKVLIMGGSDGNASVNSELYDPATGAWTVNASLPQGTYEETATLLPSGQVLLLGGPSFDPLLYNDTGAPLAWRPDIISVSPSTSLVPGSAFTVTGSLLRGVSEASGSGSRCSATDFPLLTLQDLERGGQLVLPWQSFSSTHVTSSLPLVAPGHYLLSITVNGLTSGKVLTLVPPPDSVPPTVTLTAPEEGATLKGTVVLTATATDNTAVTRVGFYDGSRLLGFDTTAPYSLSWNTRAATNGARQLTARAYDAVQSTTTPGVSVTVNNDLTAPTVSITAPVWGATVVGTIRAAATAADNMGIARVEFLEGSTLLGTVTTAPYTYDWNTRAGPNGGRTLTAKAYDAEGNSAVATVWVTADNDLSPPTVTLTAPAAGATLKATVSLTATASDNIAVTRVEFYDGPTLLGTDTTAPYSFSWDTKTAANGSRLLTARAYDAAQSATSAGVSVTVNNDLTAPTVSLSAPVEGATVVGTIALTATAADNVAVTRVVFYEGSTVLSTDTAAPYTYNWNTRTGANGSRTVTARAYDAAGNSAAAMVTVTADNDFTPPTATLTAPGEGETLNGTVVLTATASDAAGIARVAFFVGSTQVGSDSTAPYSFSYNTRLLPNGAKVISARAYDAVNNMGASAPVNVTFDNDFIAPTTSITAPTSNTTLSGVVRIDAVASDDQGTISKVDFYQGTLLLGTATTAPYSWQWDTAKAPIGTVTLKTRAWDGAGNSAYGTAVTVTVIR